MANGGNDYAYDKVLKMAVCSFVKSCGFETADSTAIDVLLQIVKRYLLELGRNSRAFAETCGRSEPVVGDITLALIDMGVNIGGLIDQLKHLSASRTVLPPPKTDTSASGRGMNRATDVKALHVGKTIPHPSYVPSFLPPFPDPHTYIETEVNVEPDTSYKSVREAASKQKRNMEIALTIFMGKMYETHPLLSDSDDPTFSLILPLPSARPYLSALIPTSDPDALLAPNGGGHDGAAAGGGGGGSATSSANQSIDNEFLRPPTMPSAFADTAAVAMDGQRDE